MQKEIKLTGMTTRPNNYDCPDGDLFVSFNLANDNGCIRPIQALKRKTTILPGHKLIYVHKFANREMWIFTQESSRSVYYREMTGESLGEANVISGLYAAPHSVTSIGLVLSMASDTGMHYVIFKNGSYSYMGNGLPDIDLRFSTSPVHYGKGGLYGANGFYSETTINYPRGVLDDVSKDVIWGMINKGINQCRSGELLQGKSASFVFPVFVRYAIRLFDGSLVSHSSPIYLNGYEDRITAYLQGCSTNSASAVNLSIKAYKIAVASYSNTISEDWKDVISGIDIYISDQLYTIDITSNDLRIEGADSERIVRIPSKQSLNRDICDCGTFYKALSLPFNSSINTIIEPDVPTSALVTQEVMKDDFRTHCRFIPKGMFAYNNRLNIFNIQTELFSGFTPESYNTTKQSSDGITYAAVFVRKDDGNTAVVVSKSDGKYKLPPYFFYPDAGAYKVVFSHGSTANTYALTKHSILNGAYLFNSSRIESEIDGSDIPVTIAANTTSINKTQLKASNAANPFFFPAANSYSIGTGEILGVASSSKAISQGQFGQFPLYAFTSDGVWALSVSSTGTYSTSQPTTRDVISSPESITQIDGAVAFSTDRGVFLLNGPESTCITEAIDMEQSIIKIKAYNDILTELSMDEFDINPVTIRQYVKGASLAYDYLNKRLILFNKEYRYAYVYAIQSGTWSMMMDNQFSYSVNNYPESILVNTSGAVFSANEQTGVPNGTGYLLTRPIKLDSPDLLKTVSSLVIRGDFNAGVKVVLFASMDSINYIPIASSTKNVIRNIHGQGYKYFVAMIIADLTIGESISGISALFDIKQNNKLR